MSDWRGGHRRHEDELDERREQSRRALSDDFAAFDASRYVRDVRRRAASGLTPPPLDAEPAERADPTADWDDPLLKLPPSVRRTATGTARRRSSLRTGAHWHVRSTARSTAEQPVAQEHNPSFLGALLGSGLAPGLRFIALAYGCFGLMLLIGLCGTFAWLFGWMR
ncbi:MAG: hypothetical protein J7551_08235 [Chloroflexi bacterium]|nr:hypothetical protein [Chloroflexota bacterium]